MTRRGVIAALAAIAGAAQEDQRMKPYTIGSANVLKIPNPQRLEVLLGKGASDMMPGFDPIVVQMGAESVTLTAREVMDALLPPAPNHCPSCGHDCGPRDPIKPGTAKAWFAWEGTEVIMCPRCRTLFGRNRDERK